MPSWNDYKGHSVGIARVMSEGPFSDGSTARLISNWITDEQNYLDSTWHLMPLIPYGWDSKGEAPTPFRSAKKVGTDTQCGVVGLKFTRMDGEVPELLLLTYDGVFRFTPWNRYQNPTYEGLTEEKYYSEDNTQSSVKPQGVLQYPAQMEALNNRIYWSFCDGAGAWVWDRNKVRPVGFTQPPSPPNADGPKNVTPAGGTAVSTNAGGFSARGRIGTMIAGTGFDGHTDAVDHGEWRYAVVFENSDGSYSATSALGGTVLMMYKLGEGGAEEGDPADKLLRRFRVFDIPKGPPETAARILLRTPNMRRLQPNDFGQPRMVHRIPNNIATDYVDDIPDSELGPPWKDRMSVPHGVYFLKAHAGSMWYMRTDAYPARVWWSEQTATGPVPESIMDGHYRDVHPSTGPITGALSVNLSDTQASLMLVFKSGATHYVSGQYPQWNIGTLHHRAGCAGPSLAQVSPDGAAIWYGSRTFWRMDSSGVVKDIGGPIRKRLQKVNHMRAHMGVSWVDSENRETNFCLPMEDSNVPDVRFVWDYMAQGWRLQTGLSVTGGAENIPDMDLTLVAGVYKTASGTEKANVMVLNRGHAGQSEAAGPREAVYQSGWMSFGGISPKMHGAYRTVQAILLSEERSSGEGDLEVFSDWNEDTPQGGSVSVSAVSPEEDGIPVYGTAAFDTDVYRRSRPYSEKLAIDLASQSHHSIKISTSTPMALYNIDVWGPQMGGPGSRNPTSDD